MAKNTKHTEHHFWSIASNLHMKRNTAGTSNELSLSVLDGLKSRSDAQNGAKRGKTAASFGTRGASLEPQGASSQDPPLALAAPASLNKESRLQRARARALENPEEEIQRRKRRRRMRRFVLAAAGLSCCIALAAAGVMYASERLEAHDQTMTVLQEGFEELKQADHTILAADAVVTSSADDAALDEISRIQKEFSAAAVHVNAAESLATEASKRLGESADRDAADQLALAASSRRSMMEYAAELMDQDVQAKTALDAVNACWEGVLAADTLMKEAAALVKDTTAENTRASQAKTEDALAQLDEAAFLLTTACEAYENADLDALGAYIAKRQESARYALASDEAIYVQDKATAEEQNRAYNQAEADAALLARDLPDNPAQPILDAFQANTGPLREEYLKVRLSVGEADAFIRDYLSSSAQ